MPLYRPVAMSPVSQGFLGAFSWEAPGFVRDLDVDRGARRRWTYRASYRTHVHLAIDYPSPIGTPVRAMKAGTIIGQGWDSSGAFLIYQRLRRGKRFDVVALYYHLRANSFRFGLGARVKKGQRIADSGDTGYTTGPHTHVELIRAPRGADLMQIYRDGIRFDPQPFLDGKAKLRSIAP
jgi:murein DD-endopeptidase MepM/ murein hydrolase activator NlpD